MINNDASEMPISPFRVLIFQSKVNKYRGLFRAFQSQKKEVVISFDTVVRDGCQL
jgi:hypothetical protein